MQWMAKIYIGQPRPLADRCFLVEAFWITLQIRLTLIGLAVNKHRGYYSDFHLQLGAQRVGGGGDWWCTTAELWKARGWLQPVTATFPAWLLVAAAFSFSVSFFQPFGVERILK